MVCTDRWMIIVGVFLLAIVFMMFYLILSVSNLLEELRKTSLDTHFIYSHLVESGPKTNDSQIESSMKQLQFIDFTILNLLQIRLSKSKTGQEPLAIKNIDEEVIALSSLVIAAIEPQLFEGTLYSKEFLAKYVVDRCKTAIIEATLGETDFPVDE